MAKAHAGDFLDANAHFERMRRKKWELRPPAEELTATIQRELGLHSIVARILANRGFDSVESVREFLDVGLGKLHNPFLCKDMDLAVRRIHEALDRKESILVYGDYDADGATSTALLLRTFRFLDYDKGSFYIPHRQKEGYGLTRAALERLMDRELDLIITVDNGISSFEEVEYAKERGVDVIVTDHHQPPDILPRACAVVNPSRTDCEYPFKSLAGVGVTFKLVHALLKELGVEAAKAKNFLASMLDLVALGTVADIVPLQNENRALVEHGLRRLEQSKKAGIVALMQLAGCEGRTITPGIVSYFLTPRINAAGRVDHASIAVELLVTDDPVRAESLANRLEDLNDQRRRLEQDILEEALQLVHEQCDLETERVIVVVGEGWHLGVIGIVASKILERWHRPVIILSASDGEAMGSARSISGFDIHEALGQTSELLRTFGGHKMAAGLRLEAANIGALRQQINEYARGALDEESMAPRITIDAEVTAEELDLESVEALRRLEPFGCTNPQPLLVLRGMTLRQNPQIVGNNHLKLFLSKDGSNFDAIGFSLGGWMREFHDGCRAVDVVFTPNISDWGGTRRVELEIKAIRASQAL